MIFHKLISLIPYVVCFVCFLLLLFLIVVVSSYCCSCSSCCTSLLFQPPRPHHQHFRGHAQATVGDLPLMQMTQAFDDTSHVEHHVLQMSNGSFVPAPGKYVLRVF